MKDFFNGISDNLRYVAMLLAGTGIAGSVLFADRAIYTVFAIGLLVIGTLLFIFDAVRRMKKSKAEKRLAAQLADNSSGNAGISEAARRAQLDALRENFQKGIAKFRAAGKDIYTLPWYMVVGEPGSGKTEAVRRSNVGFPPGLQDEMQGAGGTINMHWWFTNHAILLDTAGKLLFQEAPPGTTTEWTEFLNLLTKSRPNCPINGLILVIPADSLLKDNADDIAKKAGKICEQLDRIQRTLDVRFPVFILVTKCDLLNGFREFFSDMKDPHLQHQMTGWSNPEALDTPFKPEHVDEYLNTISQKIARRRLGLLADPVATDPNERRADEVDSLFALPNSIQSLAPRLRRYLETVFVSGEWSAKPLFLRGIYFTSALTEGKALDLELAQTLGVTPDSLPEGKLFERERSFFLRDLFIQKIFKEKGLVTRASNTRKQLKRRQFILGGTAVAGLALTLLLSIWGYFSVRDSVGAESAYWKAAATDWTKDHTWNPIVTPEFRGAEKFKYNGDNPVRVGSEQIPLHEFHARLQFLVTRDLSVPLVFKPLDIFGTTTNAGRRDAQRVLFESSVVRPAVAAARTRIASDEAIATWTARDTAALATLIQMEGIIHYPMLPGQTVEFAPGAFLTPLIGLWTPDGKIPADLNGAFDATYYERGGSGYNKWPNPTYTGGISFRENLPIAKAWLAFANAQGAGAVTQKTDLANLAKTRDAINALATAEKDFQLYASRESNIAGWLTEAHRTFTTLTAAKTALDTAIEQGRSTGIFAKDAPATLAAAYTDLVQKARAQNDAGTKAIRDVINKFAKPDLGALAAKAGNVGVVGELVGSVTEKGPVSAEDLAKKMKTSFTPEFPMLQEITARLDQMEQTTLAETRAVFGDTKPEDLALLDKNYLDIYEKRPLYEIRYTAYNRGMELFTLAPSTAETLVGELGRHIEQAAATAAAIDAEGTKYMQALMSEFRNTLRQVTRAGNQARELDLYKLHHDTIAAYLRQNVGFPILLDATDNTATPETLKKTVDFIKAARADLADSRAPSAARANVNRSNERIAKVGAILNALAAPDGTPGSVKIQIAKYDDQRKFITERGISTDFGAVFAGNLWRTARMSGRAARTQSPSDAELATIRVTEAMPPLELFLAADAKPTPDTQATFSDTWTTLRLISKAGFRKSDGKTWQAPVSIRDNTIAEGAPQVDLFLILQFQYDNQLPELADWPTRTNLGLN